MPEEDQKPAFEELLAQFQDEDKYVRRNAAKTAGDLKDSRLVEPLISLLQDEYGTVRDTTVRALGKLRDKRALPPLKQLLMNEHLSTAINLIQDAISQIQGEQFIKEELVYEELLKNTNLVEILKNQQWKLRKLAVQDLIKSNDKASTEILQYHYFDEKITEIKSSILFHLAKKEDEKSLEIVFLSQFYDNEFVQTIAKNIIKELESKPNDTKLIDIENNLNLKLFRLLDEGDKSIRQGALFVFKELNTPTVKKQLVEKKIVLLEQARNMDKKDSNQVLDELDEIDYLLKSLSEERTPVVDEVIKILGEMKDLQSVEPVFSALKDVSWFVRARAVDYLGQLEDQKVVIELIAVLRDEIDWVKQKAFREIGEKNVIELIKLLENDDIQSEVILTLEKMGKELGEEALEYLIYALENKNIEVKVGVIKILGEMEFPQVIEQLLIALKSQDEQVKKEAITALAKKRFEAIKPLIKLLEDESRRKISQKVKQEKDIETVLEFLYRRLGNDIPEVRKFIAEVFCKIRNKRVLKRLIKLIARSFDLDSIQTIDIFKEIGTNAIELLVRGLKNKDWEVRKVIVEILGEMREEQSLEHLQQALRREKNSSVTYSIRKSIEILENILVNTKGNQLAESHNIPDASSYISQLIDSLLRGETNPSDFGIAINHFSKTMTRNLFRDSLPRFYSNLRSKSTTVFMRYFFNDAAYQDNDLWKFVDYKDFWVQLLNFHDTVYTRDMTLVDVLKFFEENLFFTNNRPNLSYLEQKVIELLDQQPHLLNKDLAKKFKVSEKKISNLMGELKNKGICLGSSVDYLALDLHEFFIFGNSGLQDDRAVLLKKYVLIPSFTITYGVASEKIKGPSIYTVLNKKILCNTKILTMGISLKDWSNHPIRKPRLSLPVKEQERVPFYLTPVSKDYILNLVRNCETDFRRPNIKKIADRFDVSIRTLFRIKSKLKDKGIIQPQIIIESNYLLSLLLFSEKELVEFYNKVPFMKSYNVVDFKGENKWLTFLTIFPEDYKFLYEKIQNNVDIYEIKDEKSLGEGTNRGGSNGDDSAPTPKISGSPPDSPASMPRKLKSRKKEVEDSR